MWYVILDDYVEAEFKSELEAIAHAEHKMADLSMSGASWIIAKGMLCAEWGGPAPGGQGKLFEIE